MHAPIKPVIAAAMMSSLLAGVCRAAEPEQVWQEKCALCHGEMAQFATRSLRLVDDAPALRKGGETLEAFLSHHGRLSSGEVGAVCRALAEELKKPVGE
ncbi:MAG: hypothetical protein ACK4MF_00775 [Hyphomicrobiaceae bacterium]